MTDLPPEEAVALLSIFVFQQKNVAPDLAIVPETLRTVTPLLLLLLLLPFLFLLLLFLLIAMLFNMFMDLSLFYIFVTASSLQALDRVALLATGLANAQIQHGIRVTPDEYIKENINLGLVHVVYATTFFSTKFLKCLYIFFEKNEHRYQWALGVSFAEICPLTEVDEGTIVRCITRLDETCRDVRNCARVVGDPALFQKMQKCSEIIKRDICFAASLYLS